MKIHVSLLLDTNVMDVKLILQYFGLHPNWVQLQNIKGIKKKIVLPRTGEFMYLKLEAFKHRKSNNTEMMHHEK